MAKKVQLKTAKTKKTVTGYINSIEEAEDKKQCKALLKIFKDITGLRPKMWGDTIIGFGEYTYYRSNGDEGQFLATGFSMRKSGPTIYIMPGYEKWEKEMKKLGPHKLGKSCLYLKNLSDIDEKVLKKLIQAGLKELKKTHDVNY